VLVVQQILPIGQNFCVIATAVFNVLRRIFPKLVQKNVRVKKEYVSP